MQDERTDTQRPALLAYRTEALGQSMALGNSREPPAFAFPSRNTYEGEMLSGLAVRVKAAPLQHSGKLEFQLKAASLQQRPRENPFCDTEINNDPGNINQCRYERGGSAGVVESATPQDKRQHRARNGSEGDDPD